MRRRQFLGVLGGAATAWPLAAPAQQPMPVVGYLSARSARTDGPMMAAFTQGLGEGGYVDGQNVTIERRWGEGQVDRIPAHAADLVRRQVGVIVTAGGETVALMARAATTTIPIVFVGSGDPVQSGLVASFNRPGGNVTGVNMMLFTLTAKQLGLLRELAPASKTLAMLVNPQLPEAQLQINGAEEAARAIGQQLRIYPASTEAELDAALDALGQQGADALIVAANPLFVVFAPKIIAQAARLKLPAIYFRRELAEVGGLVSYGSSTAEAYRQAGVYASRLLKGAKPSDLPVVQSTKFEMVINLKTARALGVEIPPNLLARADEVIE
jgi:putative ABC transport system substrate-binding protein